MNSKLRKALEQIHELLSIGGKPDTAMCIRYEAANQIAKAALAEPLRNCEVGTADEQYARFKKWCEGEFYKRPINALTGEPCKSCPCYSASVNGVDGCNYLRWSQMPYEEVKK